jgi:hypothetical protein
MLPNKNLQAGQDSALRILAHETQTPNDEVLRIYESEVATLEASAHIRTFIPALALRRARARLHRRRHS